MLQIFVLAIVALMMYLKREFFGHILFKYSAYILNLLITLYFTMQNQLFRKNRWDSIFKELSKELYLVREGFQTENEHFFISKFQEYFNLRFLTLFVYIVSMLMRQFCTQTRRTIIIFHH